VSSQSLWCGLVHIDVVSSLPSTTTLLPRPPSPQICNAQRAVIYIHPTSPIIEQSPGIEHGLILFRRHHVGPAANSHGKLDAKNKNALALSAEVAAWLETSAATPVIV
jgi:hypothetical protein